MFRKSALFIFNLPRKRLTRYVKFVKNNVYQCKTSKTDIADALFTKSSTRPQPNQTYNLINKINGFNEPSCKSNMQTVFHVKGCKTKFVYLSPYLIFEILRK